MDCEHCHRPIPDDAPIYRAHARYGSYGRDVSGSLCEECSQIQPRQWHPAAPCAHCGRAVIYDASRKLPKYVLCGASACRQAVYLRKAGHRKDDDRLMFYIDAFSIAAVLALTILIMGGWLGD